MGIGCLGVNDAGTTRRQASTGHPVKQGRRCTSWSTVLHHADQLEIDHINGNRRDSRSVNLQPSNGHGHDAENPGIW